jgi:Zn2+/Cd2+-exporting ATPase
MSSHSHTAESGQDCCGVSHQNSVADSPGLIKHWQPVVSSVLLAAGLVIDFWGDSAWFSGSARLAWYAAAYMPVGFPVLRQAWNHLKKGEIFTEFFLMGIATAGAFFIGEYPEGVAVMLFYSVGEAFQHHAVNKAKNNIRALLDVRPETAHVKRGDNVVTVHPKEVKTGEIIRVKPGERVPLDGIFLAERAALDTSAITGESKPRHFHYNEKVLAGMISLNRVLDLRTTGSYENSSIARILEMVQTASKRKARTELFIRSFARVYTPAVVFLAAVLVALPALFVSPYVFEDWLYRGLVFLVISCPCALVISIPLGYFGGIGAASRNGILVKGGNYLDALKSVDTVIFDKTGTLTKGSFTVQHVHSNDGDTDRLLSVVRSAEKNSTHPIARAILDYNENGHVPEVEIANQREIPGFGIEAEANGKSVLVGSEKLMMKEKVFFKSMPENGYSSAIHVAINGVHQGYIVIADELKKDAAHAIRKLKQLGVKRTIMLSGDTNDVAQRTGRELGVDYIFGELLPEEKAQKLEEFKKRYPGTVAYVGDGINDAPVLALSDVGIAMGAMGSDVAVETADVVVQTDQPSKIATAIQIGKATRAIVWQNIGLAMGIKILFLTLGALGIATLWEAVFADVGVALLAILNAVRIQKMNFL